MLFQDNPSPYLSDPDVCLMLEFQKGGKAAFETLMRKYYPRLLNFIHRFVGQREIAEDLTQEVFMKVYQAVSAYRPESKFQTWIYTIARNISLNELRRNKKLTVSLDEPLSSQDGEFKKDVEDPSGARPDEELLRQETVRAVRQAIHALPENQRMAVILRRYEQFSYEEIARTMYVSGEAVKSLLSRAKENLKDQLMEPHPAMAGWYPVYPDS